MNDDRATRRRSAGSTILRVAREVGLAEVVVLAYEGNPANVTARERTALEAIYERFRGSEIRTAIAGGDNIRTGVARPPR